MNPDLVKSIIASVHPEYTASKDQWEANEILFRGDDDVYDKLKKYSWETGTSASEFTTRQEEAVYVEFPSLMSEKFVGILADNAPTPSFGEMGPINPEAQTPSQADLLWENADGVGSDARSWERFWADAMEVAPATSHRWIFVEAPPQQPKTFQDEIDGLRPYLVEYSPLQVPNWLFDRGSLKWARIEIEARDIRLKDGKLSDEVVTHHLLLVAEGYQGLGDDFASGGWWIFNEDGELLQDESGTERSGTWEKTLGEIPLFRLYYEKRSPRSRKKGLSHLGRMSVAYMNLLASLLNDAWTSGSRQKFVVGVSPSQWKEVYDAGLGGGKWVPIPAEPGTAPSIEDAASVSANEAIIKSMDQILDLVLRFVVRELATSPDASGTARRVEMLAGNSPRLAHMASNLEEAQNIAIYFLELRNGHASPSGGVKWPRNYDLRSAIEKIQSIFAILSEAKAQSPTLTTALVRSGLDSAGITISSTGDSDPMDTIEQEIRASLETGARGSAFDATFGL